MNVKHIPSSILKNIIKFQFINKEFNDARENIKKLKDRRLLGISYYLENSTTLDNLKLAFENVKDIPDIAIAYARKLLFLEEFRKARKVIMESWKASHSPELFKFFVSVKQEDDISVAKKFLKSMSFEGSAEFALLLYSKGMYHIAYKYFKDAFAMYPTSKILFYINELREKLGKYDDRIMREESIVDESIVFDDPSWTCTSCNHKMNKWIMENKEYIMSSLDEYFEILDQENKKRSELVAKSLVKYLQKSKENTKFQSLQMAK